MAAVDGKHQVVVAAEAFGSSQEHGLLEPMLEQLEQNLDQRPLQDAKVLADSGYCNAETLDYLENRQIDGYVADHGFRSRDPRFADARRYKPAATPKISPKARFTTDDFRADIKNRTCVCPAGHTMWLKCDQARITGRLFMQFQAHQADCASCQLRAQCLRSVLQKGARQVNILVKRLPKNEAGPLVRMKRKIDSALGRSIYSRRLGIVEPVFANIREMLGLNRFTLRGKTKVNAQWQLMTMLHNMFKIHRYGLVT